MSVASARMLTPRTGLPAAVATSTRVAITAERSTLGCGVTSTTKPMSTTTDAAIRQERESPSAPPASMMSAITTAQLAPETAVRWLSDVAFMAALSAGVTAWVSPMARPGNRPPPLPGSADAASLNPVLRPLAQPRYQGGPSTTVVAPDAKKRKATSSAGSVEARVPDSEMVLPMPRAASSPFGGSPNTATGTLQSMTRGPIVTLVSVAEYGPRSG
jgi:hypothetical protein